MDTQMTPYIPMPTDPVVLFRLLAPQLGIALALTIALRGTELDKETTCG